jgi:dienelactone hydrolase
MRASRLLRCLFLAPLALACSRVGPGDGADDPNKHGLAFARLPAAIRMNGRFEIGVRVNDALGMITADSSSMVTIRSSGQGTLRGTLSKRAIRGQVIFDDLLYDRWESITFTLSAPGFADATTHSPIPVRPVMRFVRMLPAQAPVGTLIGPIDIELVDGRGQLVLQPQPVSLETLPGLTAQGGPDRAFSAGAVVFPGVALARPGSQTLTWHSPGLGDLLHGLTVHEGPRTESLWLPAARVGVPYRTRLPAGASECRLLRDQLPRGLELEATGEIHGVPTQAQHAHLELFGVGAGGASFLWKADLPIFPSGETALPPLDSLDADGPFATGSLDDVVPVPSRHTEVRVRIFHPLGVPAAPLPVIVFHHGALMVGPEHPTVYDRFDHLLRRWSSRGFVVCTIDAPDLVWANGRLVNASLSNLTAMSENQRAAIVHLRARNGDPTFPLAGQMDLDRVIVAGHSRGGGASLITARTESAVVGGILLKPLDPMATVGGEATWNIPLPPKPFLLVIAGADADLPYPMVDLLYERRAGPMSAPTLLGSLHSFTCDASCPPDPSGTAGITREQDWAITNAYAVAFLKYAAARDLSYAPYLFGRESLATGLSPLGVAMRSDRGADALLVDDFQSGTTGRNALGLPSRDNLMTWSADEPALIQAIRSLPDGYDFYRIQYGRPEILGQSNAHRLEWEQDGATYAMALGGVDVRGRGSFVFRARSDETLFTPDRLSVRFVDSAGAAATVLGAGHAGQGIGARFTDVITPLGELRAAGLDLLRLESVELVFQGRGSLLVDDLRFE